MLPASQVSWWQHGKYGGDDGGGDDGALSPTVILNGCMHMQGSPSGSRALHCHPPPDTTHKPLVTSTLTAQMPSAQSSIAQRTQRRLAREFKLASTPITEVTKDAKPAESEDQKEAGAANGQEQAALQPASCKEKGDAALGTAREEVCLSVLLCHELRVPPARAATPVPPLAC